MNDDKIYISERGQGTEGKDIVSACAIASAGCVIVRIVVSHVAHLLEQLKSQRSGVPKWRMPIASPPPHH